MDTREVEDLVFCTYDSFDDFHKARVNFWPISAYRELNVSVFRNNVGSTVAISACASYHCKVYRPCLLGDNALEADHNVAGCDARIDADIGPRDTTTLAEYADFVRVDCCQDRASTKSNDACLESVEVLTKHDVWDWHLAVQTVSDHCPRTLCNLLRLVGKGR